jgi:endonuclease/exonuclease/phosphatase family metal-dependent hydrolase
MQLCYALPLVSFIFAIIGSVLFSIFLATWLDYVRYKGGKAPTNFILGVVAGITLDTTLNSAFLTYDIVWQRGWVAILTTVSLVLIQWLTLASLTHSFTPTSPRHTRNPLILLAIGPFLFLEFIQFQNIPHFTVFTDWPIQYATVWVLITMISSLVAITWILPRKTLSLPFILLTSFILLGSTIYIPENNPWTSAITLFLGQVSISLLIAVIINGVCGSGTRSNYSNVAIGSGMILFAILITGYYAVYLISLPYDNFIIGPIAAVIISVCALLAAKSQVKIQKSTINSWAIAVFTILVLLPSIVNIFTWEEPEPTANEGYPVRIMSYNLRNGFSAYGHLDLESLAAVIAEINPDVIALQEISRGWVISGRVDMLEWLAKKLDMYYIFGPTADAIWGNALLSKYPIVSWENGKLPPVDLYLRRGFIDVTLNLYEEKLRIIATHFHHVPEDSWIRQLQTPVILDVWNGSRNTIILGDMNAIADTPEMHILTNAGLVDVAAYIYTNPPLTFPANNPYVRIDYIWTSGELIPINCIVPYSTASDHFPIVADISQ